jgi:hypothetical protein
VWAAGDRPIGTEAAGVDPGRKIVGRDEVDRDTNGAVCGDPPLLSSDRRLRRKRVGLAGATGGR